MLLGIQRWAAIVLNVIEEFVATLEQGLSQRVDDVAYLSRKQFNAYLIVCQVFHKRELSMRDFVGNCRSIELIDVCVSSHSSRLDPKCMAL